MEDRKPYRFTTHDGRRVVLSGDLEILAMEEHADGGTQLYFQLADIGMEGNLTTYHVRETIDDIEGTMKERREAVWKREAELDDAMRRAEMPGSLAQ